MDSLKRVVRQVMEGYSGEAANGHLYLTVSPDESLYTVVGIGIFNQRRYANTALVVRIVGDLVVVERDQTDKIVMDALIQAGVPSAQIVLAYMGEPVPDAAPQVVGN